MHTEYHKEYSRHLGRDMEFKVYDTLQDYLDAGRIQLFTADTIDAQTVSFREGDPYQRIRLHEAWYRYLTEELLPRIHEINGTGDALLSTGFSMGAYHAANVFFRRPDLFDSVIALSGIYDTQDMYGGYMDEVVYANDPCASLSAAWTPCSNKKAFGHGWITGDTMSAMTGPGGKSKSVISCPSWWDSRNNGITQRSAGSFSGAVVWRHI